MWIPLFHIVRNGLEVLYFASGIVFVVIAIKGLRQINVGLEQIKVTKKIAETSARREAYKLASDQCRMLAEQLIPKINELDKHLAEAKITMFAGQIPRKFTIQDGEIISHDFDEKAVVSVMLSAEYCLSINSVINQLEGYAIPFATGVADEEIGYRETGMGFCSILARYMPAFWLMRERRVAEYKSVIELYEMWNDRLKLEELQLRKQEIDNGITKVKVRKVQTIGSDLD